MATLKAQLDDLCVNFPQLDKFGLGELLMTSSYYRLRDYMRNLQAATNRPISIENIKAIII